MLEIVTLFRNHNKPNAPFERYPQSSQKLKWCKDMLADLCKDIESLSTVDSLPFLRLMQTFNPR